MGKNQRTLCLNLPYSQSPSPQLFDSLQDQLSHNDGCCEKQQPSSHLSEQNMFWGAPQTTISENCQYLTYLINLIKGPALTQCKQTFPWKHLSKTINNNCLTLLLPKQVIIIGANKNLTKSYKEKLEKEISTGGSEQVWLLLEILKAICMCRAVYVLRKDLKKF